MWARSVAFSSTMMPSCCSAITADARVSGDGRPAFFSASEMTMVLRGDIVAGELKGEMGNGNCNFSLK